MTGIALRAVGQSAVSAAGDAALSTTDKMATCTEIRPWYGSPRDKKKHGPKRADCRNSAPEKRLPKAFCKRFALESQTRTPFANR